MKNQATYEIDVSKVGEAAIEVTCPNCGEVMRRDLASLALGDVLTCEQGHETELAGDDPKEAAQALRDLNTEMLNLQRAIADLKAKLAGRRRR